MLEWILAASIFFNLFSLWVIFHYIMYGGNPLLQLKRKLTGTSRPAHKPDQREEDNRKMAQAAARGERDPKRIVFFGASITNNFDLAKFFPDVHAINRGVGGFVPDLISKFKANVLDLAPKAAVLKLCSINVRPTIPPSTLRDGMEMMVQLAKVNGIIPIVATMVPAAKSAASIGEFRVADEINNFNNWLRQYAQDNSLQLIDYARAIGDKDGFLPRDCSVDPVHVNDKGYEVMASAAQPVIRQVMGS